MKLFSICFLLAGLSFGMPMTDDERRNWKAREMENIRLFIEETEESSKKLIEETKRVIEDENRKTANLLKSFDEKLAMMIENMKSRIEQNGN